MRIAARFAAQILGAVIVAILIAAVRDYRNRRRLRAAAVSTGPDLAVVQDAIDHQNDLLVQALCERDWAAYAALFAPDAVMLYGKNPMLRGRNAIAAMMQTTFETTDYVRAEVETTDLMVDGNLAYEVGMFEFEMLIKRKRTVAKGRYVIVWRKVGDTWLILRDIGQPGARNA